MEVRRWWAAGQDPWVKFVELFLVANGVAAVLSLLLAPGSPDWFTWTIAPDASARLLAVMYANAVLLGVIALRQPDWPHARAIFVLITVFALAATLMTFFNLGPFKAHPWYHLAYWLSGLQRVTAALACAGMAAAGIALEISPPEFSRIWPWDIPPLTGRLVGVWLLAGATAYAWTLWDGDWRRARPLFLAAPVTGLLLALVPLFHQGDIRADAAGELLVFYALAAIVAAPGLGLASAPAPAQRAAA